MKNERYYKSWKSWGMSEEEWNELPQNQITEIQSMKDVEKVMSALKGSK